MSAVSIQLQRDVEHKLIRLGLDLRDLDILVMNGVVILTGKFFDRITGQPFNSMDLQRIKHAMFRIQGVESVRCKQLDHPLFD